MTTQSAPLFTATILGSPRVGPNRELKRAVEKYWSKKIDRAELEAVAATLRGNTLRQLADVGVDSIPVNTFSYYDHMLDQSVLLGTLPPRVAPVTDMLDRYFAAARGGTYDGMDIAPLEMTKWFDTNYHYLVPEIGPDTAFSLDPAKILAELDEAASIDIAARPVIVGPITYLALSKAVDGAGAPIERLDELTAVYAELLQLLAAKGVGWVQIDEPILATDSIDHLGALAGNVYSRLGALPTRPAIFVATYFGPLTDALPALAHTPIEAIGVDLVYGCVDALAAVPALADKTVVAGVVDGRNIWRTDLESALATLATLVGPAGHVVVSTSCSTLHVPYSLAPETDLDEALRSWLAFGAEKVAEVVTLAKGARAGPGSHRLGDRNLQRRSGFPQHRPSTEQHRYPLQARRHPGGGSVRTGHRRRPAHRAAETAEPPHAADHDHRLIPANHRDPGGTRRSPCRQDRRSRVCAENERRGSSRHRVAGGTRHRRAGAR